MKRAPGLERANALQILAFEEEPDSRGRRCLSLVGCSLQRIWGLRRGGYSVEGFVGQ